LKPSVTIFYFIVIIFLGANKQVIALGHITMQVRIGNQTFNHTFGVIDAGRASKLLNNKFIIGMDMMVNTFYITLIKFLGTLQRECAVFH
jgi:hypothetical protein